MFKEQGLTFKSLGHFSSPAKLFPSNRTNLHAVGGNLTRPNPTTQCSHRGFHNPLETAFQDCPTRNTWMSWANFYCQDQDSSSTCLFCGRRVCMIKFIFSSILHFSPVHVYFLQPSAPFFSSVSYPTLFGAFSSLRTRTPLGVYTAVPKRSYQLAHTSSSGPPSPPPGPGPPYPCPPHGPFCPPPPHTLGPIRPHPARHSTPSRALPGPRPPHKIVVNGRTGLRM